MITLSENSIYPPKKTEWGKAVRDQLKDRGITQQDLVLYLEQKGFKCNKSILSKLLAGIGVTTHYNEIDAINEYLDIKFA